MELSVEN